MTRPDPRDPSTRPADMDSLIDALGSPDGGTRSAAAEALVDLGPRVVPALIRTVRFATNQLWAMGQVIGHLAPTDPAGFTADVNRFTWIESGGLQVLRELGPAVASGLVRALMDADPDVRFGALWAVTRLGPALQDAGAALRAAAGPALDELARGDPQLAAEARQVLDRLGRS